MLELIKELAGESMASQVRLLLEYFPIQTSYKNSVIKLPPYYKENKQSLENKQLPQYIRNG